MTHRLRSLVLRLRRRSPEPGSVAAEGPAPISRLACCPACRSTMVVPVAADDVGHAWYLKLRCGECGRRRLVLVDEARLHLYELELDRLEDELVSSMAAVWRDAAGDDALGRAVRAELIERDRMR